MKKLNLFALVLVALVSRPVLATPILDVAILLDASGSLGQQGWDDQRDAAKQLIGLLPQQNVRIGIIRFETISETLYSFADSQDRDTLLSAIDSLDYTGGYTNTYGALVDAITLFDDLSHNNLKSLVLFTDGKPLLPNNGQVDVCALVPHIFSRDIQTNIIGTGDMNQVLPQVDCLLQQPADFVPVAQFAGLTPGLQAQVDQLPVPAPAGALLFLVMLTGLSLHRAGTGARSRPGLAISQ